MDSLEHKMHSRRQFLARARIKTYQGKHQMHTKINSCSYGKAEILKSSQVCAGEKKTANELRLCTQRRWLFTFFFIILKHTRACYYTRHNKNVLWASSVYKSLRKVVGEDSGVVISIVVVGVFVAQRHLIAPWYTFIHFRNKCELKTNWTVLKMMTSEKSL